MLNHTYTSVKNANLVDCGKKQHIPSQPSPLIKENFLGEFRTELDRKKVLANLGIATSLSLEWGNIKGDIGDSNALMSELDSRTKYVTKIGEFKDQVISLIDGISYLESIAGNDQDSEIEQNNRLSDLEELTEDLLVDLEEVTDYLENTIEVNIQDIQTTLDNITQNVNNITNLIKVSTKEGNALTLLKVEDVGEGEQPGLYVPDLSGTLSDATDSITTLQDEVANIQQSLDTFVTKEDLGGGSFDFVDKEEFEDFTDKTDDAISDIKKELKTAVKTGEDGHVDTLYVNKIGKNNNDEHIKITDSFEVQSGIPLDVRCVVETIDDLLKLPANICYAGMGVIVNAQSALYILRKPNEGVSITQQYISNEQNWKCPEDLVTVALSRDEYNNLPEKSNNIFYYVYEEDPTRIDAPNREDFDTLEEYEQALQEWKDSLKVLSDMYMSASWGTDIEKGLSEKASKTHLQQLATEVETLKKLVGISGGSGSGSDGMTTDMYSTLVGLITDISNRVTVLESAFEISQD